MSYYINLRYESHIETIDETATQREAIALQKEYQIAYGDSTDCIVYVSRKPCKNWN